jgi:intein/homing endonuclease
MLLFGGPGVGKTTLAKLIANNTDCDLMYVNASDENNVDTVRDKIKTFASTIGFRKFKLVILDECLQEGTLVSVLRKGEETKIPIETLDETSDLVKSFNVETNQVEWQPFYLWDNGEHEIWEILLENGELVKCTADHKWFVYDSNNNIIVVTTKDLDKYNYILSPM